MQDVVSLGGCSEVPRQKRAPPAACGEFYVLSWLD